MDQMESFAPYALTGAVISQDRNAVAWASERLRFAAGNFYVNDKPTGAVVGQQPFGCASLGHQRQGRCPANLMRRTSPRSIKETFAPPRTTATRTWAEPLIRCISARSIPSNGS